MNTSYGVFSAYYLQNNYFEGGSTFRYAWVGGLSVAVALACGPLANWVNRTWGLKFCLIIGESYHLSWTLQVRSYPCAFRAKRKWCVKREADATGWICTTLGQCMAGICTHYYTFMVCQGIIFGMGIGFVSDTSDPIPLSSHLFPIKWKEVCGRRDE